MSRSERRTPIIKWNSFFSKRFAKKQANKKVRHSDNIDNGCNYKKIYCSYNIVDYKTNLYRNKNVIWKGTNHHMTIEEIMWFWRK